MATEEERARLRRIAGEIEIKVEAGNLEKLYGLVREKAEAVVPMRTLFITGGRKDKLRPGDVVGAITGGEGGLAADEVGKIEIHDRFAFVGVKAARAHAALKKLKEGRIKGRRFPVKLLE